MNNAKIFTIIFDLDGTLALIDKRRKLAAKPDGKIHWGKFFDPQNIQLDEPNIPVIEAFKAMKNAGNRVGIFSGRDSISRAETKQWLADNGIEPAFLRMRPQGSFTKDDILKKQWLDEELEMGNKILCTFDDRDKVVKMWRDNGIVCFQVAEGSF
jgi:phosphoglycolate phosphatase-like HAD superfamily hydrolase